MGAYLLAGVITATAIALLSGIAATWYDGWKDFLRSL